MIIYIKIDQFGQLSLDNTVENMWSILKRGIYGVYRNVSKKYLQTYIDEYSWRYNNRKYQDKMLERLLREITNVKIVAN